MSDQVGSYAPVPADSSPPPSQVWLSAVIRPSVATYEGLVRDPRATANRAYAWVFVSSLVGFGLSWLIGLVFPNPMAALLAAMPESDSSLGPQLIFLICGAPVAGVLAVVSLALSAGLSQLVASALGGTGTYGKLTYALAAYLTPLTPISSVISAIPLVNCLALPLALYALVLNVIAVKAVNQFGWGKAVASSVLIFAAILIGVAVLVIVILALLGPAIGTVFSNIVQDITTPVP